MKLMTLLQSKIQMKIFFDDRSSGVDSDYEALLNELNTKLYPSSSCMSSLNFL